MMRLRLAAFRQGRRQRTASRIVRPVSLGNAPPEDQGQPLFQAPGRFVFVIPDRYQAGQQIAGRDPVNSPIPQSRIDVIPQTGSPLRRVFAPGLVGRRVQVYHDLGSLRQGRDRRLANKRVFATLDCCRFSIARCRAIARVTYGQVPSPRLVGLPSILILCTQFFRVLPLLRALTTRARPCPPCPSPNFPGVFTLSTNRGFKVLGLCIVLSPVSLMMSLLMLV